MPTDIQLQILQEIRIASPCTVPWEEMQGDAKRRRCDQCNLDVHNLAELTAAEIENLVRTAGAADGRLCGRLYRRADGTVLTKDCPVGLAAVRTRVRRITARFVALASLLFTASVLFAQGEGDPWEQARVARYQPFKWARDWLGPPAPRTGWTAGSIGMMPPDQAPLAPVPPGPAPTNGGVNQ